MALYLLKANVLLMVMYGFYRLMFGRDTFFQLRRMALWAIYIFSLALPLCDIGPWMQQQKAFDGLAIDYEAVLLPMVTVSPEGAFHLSAANVLLAIWIMGMALLAARLIVGLASIVRLARQCETIEIDGVRVKRLRGSSSPFSFFKWIFVNPDAQSGSSLSDILVHEQTHAAQWHSVDIILSELMTVAFFFNPFVWLMKREVRANLEYLADERVVSLGHEPKAYQYHLLGLAYNKNVATLSNNFNVLPLKKRIKMMNKKRSNKVGRLKYLLIVPVAGLLLIACNLNAKAPSSDNSADSATTAVAADDTTSTTPETAKQAQVPQDGKVYDVVENMPSYPGGDQAMYEFLVSNMKYPVEAQKAKKEGRVVVSFVVRKDGSITDVNVIRPVDPALDAEAVRVVKAMPKWTPGKQKGVPVNVKFNMPIQFKLK